MNSSKLRQLFLSYFEEQGHKVVASSPLVPGNDPTLLFTNAGMVQFKEMFLGQEARSYSRAVSSQRCVRAGGKHNDLENVGYTARHHTFFEMLGNFSFGDYFKREAIEFAWRFLTEVLQLPKEKLWITVYQDDDEAADIWLKELGVSAERFSRCGEKDNFWAMGDTGPCGPCSEIFYDHGEHIWGGPPGTPEEDGDRYVEIWNLVFMQYQRDKAGNLTPLPKPSVDTGMGLERISAVLQGVHNNYDIDIFQTLIDAIYALTADQDRNNASFKVIADHIRSCAFLIIDGVLPGNEGRGYVLRRIIRRAVRHGHKLGLDADAFFYKLVQPLVAVMGDAYPELTEQQAHIERVLKQEEAQFSRTLSHGLKLLAADIAELSGKEISGQTAFKLFDTYGFPFDLTADIAREQGLTVDEAAFQQAMTERKNQSRASSQFSVDLKHELKLDFATTFVGYQQQICQAKVEAIINEQGQLVDSVDASESKIGIILDKTPFYAESGGQIGDMGLLQCQQGEFVVSDTQKQEACIVHYGVLKRGTLAVAQQLEAAIDVTRRDAIRLNHSATHLLHAALKSVLGNHVQQKGSLVNADKARFDFSHYQGLSLAELQQVELLVNQQIRHNHLIETIEMSFDEAKADGAVALFGEKYGDKVRVLKMGDFSKELCGGTHAARTGDIGFCKLVSETGIASGIRRIEFVSGDYATQYIQQQENVLQLIAQKLHTSSGALVEKLDLVLTQQKQLEKQTEALKAKMASASGQRLLDGVEQIGDYQLLMAKLDGADPKSLRTTLDSLRDKIKKGVIVLVAVNGDKMNVVAGITKAEVGQLPDAKRYIEIICGKGGGRPDMAQGGGLMVSDLNERFQKIKQEIQAKIGE